MSCALTPLDEEGLVRVLTEPKNALVKQYQSLFQMEHCDLEFTEQALSATTVDRVIVTTDSDEIGVYAEFLGAEYFRRSPLTATDTASSESALTEVLDARGNGGLIVFLQATSPIRQPGDIDNAVRILKGNECDSLFTARHIEGYTWTVGSVVTPNYYERQPRQAHSMRRLEENGSIYVFYPWVLQKYGSRLGGNVTYYEMHALDSFQVDEPADLELLEQIMPLRLQLVPA